MRFLVKSLITVGLVLGLSSSANATVSITLTQTGGTYAGSAVASDTLILSVDVVLGVGDALTLADPYIDAGGAAVFVSGTEAAFAFIAPAALTPIAAGFNTVGTTTNGWELGTLTAGGGATPGTYNLGTVTYHLTGAAGVLTIGGATTIGGANFADITGISNLGTFTINAVPEPTTVAMLGMGLLGLAVSGRRR